MNMPQTAQQHNFHQVGTTFEFVPSKLPTPVRNGVAIVYGVPWEILPILFVGRKPEGKMRLRFRARKEGRAYFKTANGIRCFLIENSKTHWVVGEDMEVGRNIHS